MGAQFTSLTEHQQLVFWTELAVVLVVARSLGAMGRRVGLPPVVGELAAGVVLGPSVLGHIWSRGFGWLFPLDTVQSGALNAVAWVGVGLLLLLTGFETDLSIVRRLGRAAGSVATGSLLLPLSCGALIGIVLPASFMGPKAHRSVFALFMAVSLGVSSLPVIAKILSDLGLMRRDFGQVTLAVSSVNDLIGWVGLGVVAGLAESGSLSVGRLLLTIGAVIALLGGGLTIGQRATDSLLRLVRARTTPLETRLAPSDTARQEPVIGSLTATLVITLAVATAAQAAGIEAVLGAYVAGIVLGRSRFQHPDVGTYLQAITTSFLAPIFFATAGLKLDLGSIGRLAVLWWVGVILAAAVLAMFAGAYLGARVGRLAHRDALALGAALNARGAVEVVIAAIGLSLGVLGPAAYTAVVLMAIFTSVMAAPLLRRIVSGWEGTGQERQRLDQERLLDTNLLVRPGRILLPSRGRPNSIVAGQVLHFAFPPEVGVTVLSVSDNGDEPDLVPLVSVFEGREVEVRRTGSPDPLAAVADEARLGYQAIGVGISDGRDTASPTGMVERLLDRSPVPLVVV
ncbi:MAG TPA: cation:proton antiporter, partial [Acidimicrobiales bacterium]|nr:cation:proton antiporter [Acidimicrobiales bacterium]